MLEVCAEMQFVRSCQGLTRKGAGVLGESIERQEKGPACLEGQGVCTPLQQGQLYMHNVERAPGTQGEVGAAIWACYLPALCEL